MTDEMREIIEQVLKMVSATDYIKPEDLPNISLYMDQVTTFMEEQLSETKRYPDDKILTKTMINNYAKNKLLPPPDKKRYSREHLLLLIFIYYFKNILSIHDIQTLLGPITERYFQSGTDKNMSYIYKEIFDTIFAQTEYLKKDLLRGLSAAEKTFANAPSEDQPFLRDFSFICLLSFDVYMKKMLIENLIDGMQLPGEGKAKDRKRKAKEKPKE